METNNIFAFIAVIAVIILAAALGWYFFVWQPSQAPAPGQTVCTMEAKICPDGSSVGRTGANCEFAPCPEPQTIPGWQTFSDAAKGISFQYPPQIDAKYISLVDWPPQVQILDQAYSCTPGGSEIARAGQTTEQMINNHTYCVTKESEGAAGSIYTMYAYTFARGRQTAILTFSLRFVQCGNYPEPQMTECNAERAVFSIDGTADQMARSLVINQ